MDDWGRVERSKHILIIHVVKALTVYQGKEYKVWIECIIGICYDTVVWHIDVVKCGASLWSSYMVTFCYPKSSRHQPPLQMESSTATRPFHNLISTYGTSPSQYHPFSILSAPTHLRQPNYVGKIYNQPVYNWDGPSCGKNERSWILVPEYGIRRLQQDGINKIKILDHSMYTNMSIKVLSSSIEQYVWACIGKYIAPFLLLTTTPSTNLYK